MGGEEGACSLWFLLDTANAIQFYVCNSNLVLESGLLIKLVNDIMKVIAKPHIVKKLDFQRGLIKTECFREPLFSRQYTSPLQKLSHGKSETSVNPLYIHCCLSIAITL